MKSIFLDRDGCLIQDKDYSYRIEDFELIPGVFEALRMFQESLYSLFIATNQSGVGRGLFSLEDLKKFHSHFEKVFRAEGVEFKKIYAATTLPEENSPLRKPAPGIIQKAQQEFGVETEGSWVIGDRLSDIEFAKNAGCSSVLVMTGQELEGLRNYQDSKADFVAVDILHAAQFICKTQPKKFISFNDIQDLGDRLRSEEKKIVSLNGSFDIIHAGHQKILSEAKAQGDKLIVALNTDRSVKRYKGELRPINSELSRWRMISSFDEVDYVCIFDADTPISFLEALKPDVHANGSEYGEDCVEADTVKSYGGKIHIVQLEEGFSSSHYIKKKFGV